ncbi:MAG: SPASM domain-containing protein [Candidatus Omnitrophica bacterium]|nr:SPASM domain-containing protein [Candidatus Omnitrophota bacterium]
MPNTFNGLYCIHLELTSLCNKDCWMCGRRKIDRDYPEIAMNYGHMEFSLVEKIAAQVPEGIVVQFHNNGDPLLYPRLGDAVRLFQGQIRCLDTNGKLLVDQAEDMIDNLDTLTVSVIENDPEADEQYAIVKKFLALKGNRKPLMVYRLLGQVKEPERWEALEGVIARRNVHNPLGSFQYTRKPTVPEIGMCVEILNHMAINRFGKVSACVRFDPQGLGVLGDVNLQSLSDIWNGEKRRQWVDLHKQGKRKEIPFCGKCDYWGVPTGS